MLFSPSWFIGHQRGHLSRQSGIDVDRSRPGLVKDTDSHPLSAIGLSIKYDATDIFDAHTLPYGATTHLACHIADVAIVADDTVTNNGIVDALQMLGIRLKFTYLNIAIETHATHQRQVGLIADHHPCPIRGLTTLLFKAGYLRRVEADGLSR